MRPSVMSTSVDSLGRFHDVVISDYENSSKEDDCCLQPLELVESTDDDVGSCVSATTCYSRLSIRGDVSDLVLAADLSSSEFADSTPIESDIDTRSEHQTNLESFLERSNTGADLSKFSPVYCPSSPSTSPPSSPPPTVAPRLPSTLLYTKSLRPHRIKTAIPFIRREVKPLKLLVSIPFNKLGDSQISRFEESHVKCPDHTPKEPAKKICRQKCLNKQKQNRSRKRSLSPSPCDIVITVPSVAGSLSCENNSPELLQPEINVTSNLSWETANNDVMFSTPVSNVSSSVAEPQQQQQPYVVTVECSSTDEFPSKRMNRGMNSIDKIATSCMKNRSFDTSSSSSFTSQDQSTTSSLLMDTVESLHNHNHSTAGSIHVSSFSFEAVFGFYPPDLTIIDGELAPAHSLSLKDSVQVPFNHPIHKWSFGRRVNGRGSVRKRKRCPQRIVR